MIGPGKIVSPPWGRMQLFAPFFKGFRPGPREEPFRRQRGWSMWPNRGTIEKTTFRSNSIPASPGEHCLSARPERRLWT